MLKAFDAKGASDSGDVKVYGAKTLAAFFSAAGFQAVRVYQKGAGMFLKARK